VKLGWKHPASVGLVVEKWERPHEDVVGQHVEAVGEVMAALDDPVSGHGGVAGDDQ
jgi:hypothetical protein